MAKLRKKWFLVIPLLIFPTCFASGGHPAPPSRPDCYKPCTKEDCMVDIHCRWNAGPNPQIPTNYSLHWESANSDEGRMSGETSGTNQTGGISRANYPEHGELRVWVEATNQYGSSKSEEVIFNTADIIKPLPPNIAMRQQQTLEIEWDFSCGELHHSFEDCCVRYRIEGEKNWLKNESGFHNAFMIDSPQSCSVYEVQVSCVCSTGSPSDWSTIHKIKTPDTAPTGELDIWRDCGISSERFKCALTWKELPASQACGVILRYEIRLFYNNGTMTVMNVSTAEQRGSLYYLTSSLKDVSSVNISAFNIHGATVPSHLTMPGTGKEKNEQHMNIILNKENLTVSWDPDSKNDNLNEYVVQYKQVGSPPGQGFQWVKVPIYQTTVFFKGQFKEFTPHEVSLFALSASRKIRHLSSEIKYSSEGISSKVPSFKAISIAATQVTLSWEPPLDPKGIIQYYQIGLDRNNVYNVSVSSQHENGTYMLKNLIPNHEYEVWIRAVTVGGDGEKQTMTFTTDPHFAYLIGVAVGICVLVIICFTVVLCCLSVCGKNKECPLLPLYFCEKVPDPRNSHIIKQMKHQINDPFAWICMPIYDQHPKISVLEVVEIPPDAFKPSDPDALTSPIMGDGCSQMNCQDDQSEDAATERSGMIDHRSRRQEYSKMVDSDEERDREEDEDGCWGSEDEQLPSGYEKHFMPTAFEILGV